MTKISEQGINGSVMPRVYANKIVLNNGSGTDFRGEGIVDKTRPPAIIRQKDGNVGYRAAGNSPPHASLPGAVQANLQVYIQDIMRGSDDRGSWMGRPRIRSRLKVQVIQSTNKKLTQALIKKNFDISILQKYNLFVDYQIMEAPLQKRQNQEDTLVTFTNGSSSRIVSLVKDFQFLMSDNPEHLTYFLVTERERASTVRGATANHGAVTVERVIENFAVIKSSFVLREAGGQIWAGPAHRKPGTGWMEGYFHTSTSHQTFQRDVVNNFKVADLRVLGEVKDLQIDILSKNTQEGVNYLSDLYLARTPGGSSAALFNVDYLKFLIDNSKFGGLIANAKESIQKEIIANCKLASLSVTRHRVKVAQGVSPIDSASEVIRAFATQEPPQVIAQSGDTGNRFRLERRYTAGNEHHNKIVSVPAGKPPPDEYQFFGSIEEVRTDNTGHLRTFAIQDGLAGVTSGVYQYEALLRIKDGSYKYLNDRLTELGQAIIGMKTYLSIAEQPSSFDYDRNQFFSTFVNSQFNSATFLIPSFSDLSRVRSMVRAPADKRAIQVWLGSVVNYVEALDVLTNISNDQKKRLTRALYFLVSPTTGSPDGIEMFIAMLETLEGQLSTLLVNAPRHLRDRSDISRADRATELLSLEGKFPQTFDSTVLKSTGFSYFGANANNGGILRIRQKEVEDTIQEQIGHLSSNLYDVDTLRRRFNFIGSQEASAFYSQDGALSFVAPTGVQIAGTAINLWSRDSLDFISITAIIQNMVRNSTGNLVNMEPKSSTFKLLGQVGKGSFKERLQSLNRMYVDNAIDAGILIESVHPAGNHAALASSDGPMGTDNKFTAAPTPTEALTTQLPSHDAEDVLSVLDRVLEIDNISSHPSFQSTPPANISFDLEKQNNFFVKTLQTNLNFQGEAAQRQALVQRIRDLPPQIKRLALNRGRYYNDDAGSLATADDAQTDGFVYNFGMIRRVEYLDGYDRGMINRPRWKKMDAATLNSMTSYKICRVVAFTDPKTNIGAYGITDRIPVYNEYFLVGARSRAAVTRPAPVARLRPDGFSYRKASFVRGAERDIFLQLITFEAQERMLGNQIEYTMSEPPLPPAGEKGATTAAPTPKRAQPSTSPQTTGGASSSGRY